MVESALGQQHAAELPERLRATLVFLEKLTLAPHELSRDDLAQVLKAGVSRAALHEAIHVVALYTIVGHIADALDFDIPRTSSQHANATGHRD